MAQRYVVPEESPLEYPSAGAAGSDTAAPTTSAPINSPSSSPHHGNLSWTRLIQGLASDETREEFLDLLCKNRQDPNDLALLLWNSFGTIRLLLKEITSVYRNLLSTSLEEREVKRACNAIALLQSVASHPDTRKQFVKAYMPLYIYPFLSTVNRESPYERLRLTSLSVLVFLVKDDDAEVVEFFLHTQIFPSCLRCMDFGGTLSKSVATFIIYRILLNQKGLQYCFVIAERFLSVCQVLWRMVEKLDKEDQRYSPRLLKNIISCYLRLSESERARHNLTVYIPSQLADDTYISLLQAEPEARSKRQQLIRKLKTSQRSRTQSSRSHWGH